MAGPGDAKPGMPSLARIRSCASRGYLARIRFLPGPMPKSRQVVAESGARCGPRGHREMSNHGRATEFFARTDPADSRNVESQRGLLQDCGLAGTVLGRLEHLELSVRHV